MSNIIGVNCSDHQKRIIGEFFELFKTPWEFCRPGKEYGVVVSTGPEPEDSGSGILILYGSQPAPVDRENGLSEESRTGAELDFQTWTIPIYGECLHFNIALSKLEPGTELLSEYAYLTSRSNRPVIRIGYDLAGETDYLLNSGQPPSRAMIPTLELHIHLLRCLLLAHGRPVVEIPPVPSGCSSITCLTHDVDFVRINDHKFDRTMLGFLRRALIGSAVGIFKGRTSWARLKRNWLAALSLPLVFLGICRDFFNNFREYLEIEGGPASTFFLIPFKNRSGKPGTGQASAGRSVKYDIADIGSDVKTLVEAGCEIGLHGIDAWADREQAQAEIERIRKFSDKPVPGIRMHWLYFGKDTPQLLENAGFTYDSTLGYNDAAGFRCGTAQVFRFPEAENLSELPLIIQDTALFYPDRMGLDEWQAENLVKELVDVVEKFGGSITFNWHQRSLGPERQWGSFYRRILECLESRGTLFMNAQETVNWFSSRRSAKFESVLVAGNTIKVRLLPGKQSFSPGIKLRVYRPLEEQDFVRVFREDPAAFVETDVKNDSEIEIRF